MKLSKLSKIVLFPFFAGVFSIPSIFSLLRQGFFTSDDGGWMIIRFAAFYSSFSDGQFPVRFLKGLNFGYGYPVANFLYPGFMYMATPFHFLGFGFVDSVKIVLMLSFIFSSVFTFLWLRTLFGKLPSLIGSVLFVYTPYHLYDLYKRGSVGEIVSLTFVPLVLYGVEKRNYYVISISIFLLIVSHNSMALLFLPVIVSYILIRYFLDKKIFFGVGTGIALSSFFIVPAVFELGYTYFKKTTISNPSEYFVGLEMIGIISILLLLASLVIFKMGRKNNNVSHNGLFVLFISVSFISMFLSTFLSEVIWKTPIASLLQFPFRVLSLLLLTNAFFAAYILNFLKGTRRYVVFILLLIISFYSSFKFMKPAEFTNIPDTVYATNPATTTVKNEYMPMWVKEFPTSQYEHKVELLNGKGEVINVIERSNRISFELDNSTSTKIRLNTVYYPGWRAYVDNNEVDIHYENSKGVMDIPIAEGQRNIRFVFSETPLRILADGISVIAVVLLIAYSFRKVYKFKK